jgi:putative addiction module component (TIGR02574 family)
MSIKRPFDGNPSESPRLLEDLCDDLAAGPADVPIHDWQKEELARRKANLTSNPASAMRWQEIQAKIQSPQ